MIEEVEEIVNWLNSAVRRVRWTNDEIDRKFGKRSAIEILEQGETFYMNPCLDLTLVTSAVLRSSEIEHDFVIEEHMPTDDFPFSRLHFVIEFESGQGKHHINYATLNRVYVDTGFYQGHKILAQSGLTRIPGEIVRPNRPFHENFGLRSLDELAGVFKGYQFPPQIARLKQDNTPERYEEYQRKCQGLVLQRIAG